MRDDGDDHHVHDDDDYDEDDDQDNDNDDLFIFNVCSKVVKIWIFPFKNLFKNSLLPIGEWWVI